MTTTPTQRRIGFVSTTIGLALVSLLGGGCLSAELHSEVPSLDPAEHRRVARAYERGASPVENLNITATLWDPALLASDRSMRNGSKLDESERADRTQRWQTRYLDDTTFTVVLELANRPGPPRRAGAKIVEDVAVDPARWRFSLASGHNHREPRSISVQGIDRFPTRAGGWHWRIILAVHFEGSVAEVSDEDHPLILRAYPPAPDRGRSEWGRSLVRRGVALRWWLSRA